MLAIAEDLLSGTVITRPSKDALRNFDLDIKGFCKETKKWFYYLSSNYSDYFKNQGILQRIEISGGKWRIVNAKTGDVVSTNDKT